jgi:hypothetical protein
MGFINVLNQSAVTFIQDLGDYGWGALAGMSGYEAISPTGEIMAFTTYKRANNWRMAQVRIFHSFSKS